MALDAFLPPKTLPTGTTGTGVRPITEGERVTVVEEQQSTGIWSVLDDIGTTAATGIKDIIGALAQREVARLTGSGAEVVDSTGDPADQPGARSDQIAAPAPVYVRYAKELKIAAAVAVGVAALIYLAR